MAMTIEQFSQHLTSSGLMTEEALRDWIAATPIEARPRDGEALARALVKQKLLTKFQAEQLYAGKGKSLTLGNYVLLDKLGQGGMGMVFKAQHKRMGRVVALKVMSARAMQSSVNVQRFHREVQMAAKLTHPNIVTAHDADEAKGTHFLVMELVEGDDLSAYVKRHGPMTPDQAIECIIQAARGLGYAHALGVVHRDIKPHNLLLSRESSVESREGTAGAGSQLSSLDSQPRIKILDMGLARLDGSVGGSADQADLTNSGAMMGTVDYMAPEQAMDSKRADARSDIYSLGCTLFYLLTGQVTFIEDTVMKRLTAHQHSTAPSLVEAVPAAHLSWHGGSTLGARPSPARLAALNGVFQRMVAKNPAERFQSMSEVVSALERCRVEMPAFDAATDGDDSALQSFLKEMTGGSSTAKSRHAVEVSENTIALPLSNAPVSVTEATLIESDYASHPSSSDTGTAERTMVSTSSQTQTAMWQRVPRRVWIALAGFAAVLLFGVIVFKITRPDGTVTKLTVPEGTDVDLSGLPKGSKVEVVGNTPAMAQVAKVKLDLTPAKPLGTWEMGPEPEWFREGGLGNPYLLKESPVLPGLVERPAKLAGIKRWNVDTIASRNRIHVVKYSPDGKWIATGGMDGHVRIYDAKTQDLHRLLPGRAIQTGVYDVSWHPDNDRLAIVADQALSLRIIDRSGHVLLEERFDGNQMPLHCVAWNHSGTQFAIGTVDNREQVEANLEIREPNGKLVKRLATEKGLGCHRIGNVVWSPDDKQLAVRHLDDKVRLWNLETGDAHVLDEDVQGDMPHSIAWSKDDWIAVSTSKGTRLYDPDRKLTRTLETTYGQPIWSPDGKRIIVLTHGPQRVVARDTGAVIAEGAFYAVAGDWHPDGTQIAGGYHDFTVASADLQTVNRRYTGFFAESLGSDWSPDGRWLATNGYTRVFSEDGREQPFVFENKPAEAQWFHGRQGAFVWRPDSKILIGGPSLIPFPNQPQFLHLWARTEDGITRKFFNDSVPSVDFAHLHPRCWSPDGKYVIVTYGKGTLLVLDATGKLVKKITTGGTVDVLGPYACWNPATNLVAVLENGQPLKFLDPARDWELRSVSDKPLAVDANLTPQWSPDGQILAFGSSEWFDSTGAPLGIPPVIFSRWSPDGKHWIATHQFGDVGIFDTGTKTQTRHRVSNNNWATSHAWHPRGHLIAHVSGHSMVTVWRESDLQPHWHASLLPEGKSATFSAAGELLNDKPADLDPYLIYYLDRGNGQIETLTPAEFRKLLN